MSIFFDCEPGKFGKIFRGDGKTYFASSPGDGILPIPDAVGCQLFCDFLSWTELAAIQATCKQFKQWSNIALREISCLTASGVAGQISTSSLESFLQKTGIHLKKIVLSGCVAFCDDFLDVLTAHCPQIEIVKIQDCPRITGSGVRYFLERCHNLQHIYVEHCGKVVGDDDVFILGGKKNCKLSNVSFRHSDRLSLNGVTIIAVKAKDTLKHVDFTGCKAVNDIAIERVVQVCTKLESISFGDGTMITDLGMQHIARFANNTLKELCIDAGNISDIGFQAIGRSCKQLSKIKLKACVRVTDIGVSALVVGCPLLSSISLINVVGVGNGAVTAIAQKCKQLSYLDVQFMRLEDDVLIQLAKAVGSNLEHLCLRSCGSITDRSILLLSKLCTGLKYLDLFCCYNITEQSAKSIAFHLQSLEFLDLSWCYRVTPETVLQIVKRCRNLSQLKIIGCDEVASMAQSYIIESGRCKRDLIVVKEQSLSTSNPTRQSNSVHFKSNNLEQNDQVVRKTKRRSSQMRPRSASLFAPSLMLGSTATAHSFPASRKPLERIAVRRQSTEFEPSKHQHKSLFESTTLPSKSTTSEERVDQVKCQRRQRSYSVQVFGSNFSPLMSPKSRKKWSKETLYDTVESSHRRIFGTLDSDLARERVFSKVEANIPFLSGVNGMR